MAYAKMRALAEELGALAERLEGAWRYIFGDRVPFGPWTVDTSAFLRYGRD
ncbi:hypothetical protein AB0G55_05065 [Streptomyces toyocaensis]|uniref:hypothetical protein n=1 Tax=Streptomyces toyocaensis TaxID=55952 RepID=UPI000AC56167|nr:hypothetical protein [Streptomyces toyocaensis]